MATVDRKQSDVRQVTLRFDGGVEKTYSVFSTCNKADVIAWAACAYPDAKVVGIKVGIVVQGRLNWDWEAE